MTVAEYTNMFQREPRVRVWDAQLKGILIYDGMASGMPAELEEAEITGFRESTARCVAEFEVDLWRD